MRILQAEVDGLILFSDDLRDLSYETFILLVSAKRSWQLTVNVISVMTNCFVNVKNSN